MPIGVRWGSALHINMIRFGGVAQLGERLPCTQEAIGSNPFTSTIYTVV